MAEGRKPARSRKRRNPVADAPRSGPAVEASEVAAEAFKVEAEAGETGPFAATFGYSPATYGQASTEDVSHIAATLESKRDRLRKAHDDNGAEDAEPAALPFQETHGYSPATYRRPEYLDYLEKATVAIRTVRLYVYAFMTAFLVVAFYVFFLIYQLTTDLHRAVEQTVVMTAQMAEMTQVMSRMGVSIATMDTTMADMNGTVRRMDGSVGRMTSTVGQMANTVALMQHSAANLDQSIGPVMGTMNRFMPFGWGGNNYRGAPPYAPPVR